MRRPRKTPPFRGPSGEVDMDMRLLWLHAFVPWLEHEPVLDKQSQEQIRAALKRLKI